MSRRVAGDGFEHYDRIAHLDRAAGDDRGHHPQRPQSFNRLALRRLQPVAAGAGLGDFNARLTPQLQTNAWLKTLHGQAGDDDLLAKLARFGFIALRSECRQPFPREQVEMADRIVAGFLIAFEAMPGDQVGARDGDADVIVPPFTVGPVLGLIDDAVDRGYASLLYFACDTIGIVLFDL